MVPIFDTFFMEMSNVCETKDILNEELFAKMLTAATQAIQNLVGAKLGDKTLLDTLIPANEAFSQAVVSGKNFKEALLQMKTAAVKGKKSTHSLIARIGRACRLGERSRGVLEAGATSCDLILQSLADLIIQLID